MLAMVNLFSGDIEQLGDFYGGVLGLEEMTALRSPIFRAFEGGGCMLGINDRKAFDLLSLEDGLGGQGVRTMLTFQVASREAVDEAVKRTIEAGGRLAHAPYDAGYGWFAVLLDPQGNALRVGHRA